jgi:predicted nucleic acid-binding protein
VSRPLVADTGGLLRALARAPDGSAAWPEYERAVREAKRVVVPAFVLVEVDYFLRSERAVMRKLVAELFDPATTYEYQATLPEDVVRAMTLDAKFVDLGLGLVDGVVAAVAERRRVLRVLTTDHAHFSAIRVGPHFRQALTLVP